MSSKHYGISGIGSLVDVGKDGPKLKSTGGVIEARNTLDNAYVIFRALSPSGSNDVVTKGYFDANTAVAYAQFVSVAKSGGDYTTATAALAAITDAAANKKYAIQMYPGVYDEQLTLKDYIDIIGIGPPRSVVVSSSSGTVVTMSNANRSDLRNITISRTSTTNGDNAVEMSAGTHLLYDVVLEQTSTGAYGCLVNTTGSGTLQINTGQLTLVQSGVASGSGNTNALIHTTGSTALYLRNLNAYLQVGDTEDHAVAFREESTAAGLITWQDCNIDVNITISSYTGVAAAFDMRSATIDKYVTTSKIRVRNSSGSVSGTGKAYVLSSTAGGGYTKSTSNTIDVDGFANNYLGDVATGDTLVTEFDSVVAINGAIGAGDISNNDGTFLYHGVYARSTAAGLNCLPTHITTTTFTLGATANPIRYYYKGINCIVSADKTATLDDGAGGTTAGIYYVYFSRATGALLATKSFPGITPSSNVIIANIVWNGSDYGLVSDERHGYLRNHAWHQWAHSTVGVRYRSGFDFAPTGTGLGATFTMSSGELWDEDISFSSPISSSWPTPNALRTFYQTGASTYVFDLATVTTPFRAGAAGRPTYVNATGYVLTQASSAVNRYFNFFIYGTQDMHTPVYCFVETVPPAVAADNGYTNTANARAVPFPNLAGFSLSPELKPLYRLVVRADGQVQSLISADDYRSVSSLPMSAGISSTTASAVSFTPAGTISSTNVQLALEELDSDITSLAPTTVTVAAEATDTTCFPLFVTAASGVLGPKTSSGWGLSSDHDYTGIGVATSGLPRMFLGTNAPSNDDSALLICRAIAGTDLFSHAIRDESTFTSLTTGAYCSFDSIPVLNGDIAYNHLASFQSRHSYAGGGTLTDSVGFSYALTTSGAVTASTAFRVYDFAGAGSVANFYALYIPTITKPSAHWSIYSTGTSKAYHAGNFGIGTTNPLSPLSVSSDTAAPTVFQDGNNGQVTVSSPRVSADTVTKITFSTPGYAGVGANAGIGVKWTSGGTQMMFGTSNTYTGISNTAIIIEPSGIIGVGASSSSSLFNVTRLLTNAYGFTSRVSCDTGVTGDTSLYNIGLEIDAKVTKITASFTDSGYKAGLRVLATPEGADFAGTQTSIMGVMSYAGIGASCTAGAVVTNAYGVFVTNHNLTSGTTITNSYGIYIDSRNSAIGTITNAWDVYAVNSTAKNYFAGQVGIGVAVPGVALEIQQVADGNPIAKVTGASNPMLEVYSTYGATSHRGCVQMVGTSSIMRIGTITNHAVYFSVNDAAVGRFHTDGNFYVGTTDFDGTPAVGRLTVAAAGDGSTDYVFVGRNVTGANKATLAATGLLYLADKLLIGSTTGQVNINGNQYTAPLHVANDTSGTYVCGIHVEAASTAAVTRYFYSNGTIASKTAAANGDTIGGIQCWGYDGTNFKFAGAITGEVDGVVGTADMPGRLVFYVNPDGTGAGSGIEAARISNAGYFGIGQNAPTSKLDVTDTFTNASKNVVRVLMTSSTTSSGSYVYTALYVDATPVSITAGENNANSLSSIFANSVGTGTGFAGTQSYMFGTRSYAGIGETAAATAAITNCYGGAFYCQNQKAGSTITNAYAVYANSRNVETGTITNSWDIYAASGLAKNYFAGDVGMGVSPTYPLHVYRYVTDSSGTRSFIDCASNVTSNGTYSNIGLLISGTTTYVSAGVTDSGSKIGLALSIIPSGTYFKGALSSVYGMSSQVGIGPGADTGSGITNAVAGNFSCINNTASTVINNSYGVYINSRADVTGTITNSWDVYAASATAKNYFAGNVGIGTNNATSHLHVVATTPQVSIESASSWAQFIATGNTVITKMAALPASSLGLIGTESNHNFSIYTNNLNRVTITAGGLFGIGTTNPLVKFHVISDTDGSGRFYTYNDSNASNLMLGRGRGTEASPTIVTNSSVLGSIYYIGYDGSAMRYGASIRALVSSTPGANDMPTTLYFGTSPDGGDTPVDHMFLTHTGYVGIGTSPSSKLHVLNTAATSITCRIDGSDSNYVYLCDSTAGLYSIRTYTHIWSQGGGFFCAANSGFMSISGNVVYGTAAAENMRIVQASGNVHIASTDDDGTPATGRLVVKGSTIDGSTNIFVGRDDNGTNVITINSYGQIEVLGPTGAGSSTLLKLTKISGYGSTSFIQTYTASGVYPYGFEIFDGTATRFGIYGSANATHANWSYISGELYVNTTDIDGTPAVGQLTVESAGNSSATNIFVGRDSDHANVCWIDSDGLAQFVGGAVLGLDAATNTAGSLKLWSGGANNYYTSFTTGTQTGDCAYTLPLVLPSVNSVLQTTSAGAMSWVLPMSVTAAPGSDHTVSGLTITLNANETHNFGDVCYINSDGQAQLIDADAIATMSGVVMATATISADADGVYLLMGIARDDTWTWTVGGLIYGTVTGTTGNTLSQTAPTGTNDVIQILGVATHADRMLFNPQLVQVEHT